jgi:serine/threonine protein kinase
MVHQQNADLYLVFEYVENDLSGLLDAERSGITPHHIKSYMYQVCVCVQHTYSIVV